MRTIRKGVPGRGKGKGRPQWSWLPRWGNGIIHLVTHSFNNYLFNTVHLPWIQPWTKNKDMTRWKHSAQSLTHGDKISECQQFLMVSTFRDLSHPFFLAGFPGEVLLPCDLLSTGKMAFLFYSGPKMSRTRGKKIWASTKRGKYLNSCFLEGSMVNTQRISFWMFLCACR